MSTYLSDKCDEIRSWLAIGEDVYSDAVVTGWIRMAEEYLSNALRVKHMIQIDTASLVAERVPLPSDWQELRLVRNIEDGGTYRYTTPDDFYGPPMEPVNDPPPNVLLDVNKYRRYTILGNYVVLDLTISNPLSVELTYYQNIPPLTDAQNNWINQFHPSVYTLKILHIASLYAIEDERGPTWSAEVVSLIGAMNTRHSIDKASGSVLMPVRRKTFG